MDFGHFKRSLLDCVIPAWSAGIQVDMDGSGSILAHLDAGMTKFAFSFSVGERKIMERFVVDKKYRCTSVFHRK